MTKAECILHHLDNLFQQETPLPEDWKDIVAKTCNTSVSYVTRLYNANYLEKPKGYLVVNRFEAWCLDCGAETNKEAISCPSCERVFTHVTTTCPLSWMRSVLESIRKDLEFIRVGDI